MMHGTLLLQLIAFTHATVLDPSSGGVTADRTIVVSGNRIQSVGGGGPPAGAQVIDVRGQFVIPGLWDMHVHNDIPGGRSLLSLYVAHGVTGVRDMNGALPTLRSWQREIAAGTLVGPRMIVAGPYLVGARVPLPHIFLRSPDAAAVAVDSLARLGVDFIKVHNALSPEVLFAIARAARSKGIPFAGHVFPPLTPLAASDSGQRSLEHLSGFVNECTPNDSVVFAGALPLQRMLLGPCTAEPQGPTYRKIARNGTWVTPTLTVQVALAELRPPALPGSETARFYSDSLLALMRMVLQLPPSPSEAARAAGRAMFAKRVATVGALHRAAVPLLTGTDSPLAPSPPGAALHDELEFFVQAGLSPLAALRAATTEPVRYLAATDSLGSVATGKVADFVVLAANPLDDIRNTRRISFVVANGGVYDAGALAALIEGVKQAAGPRR